MPLRTEFINHLLENKIFLNFFLTLFISTTYEEIQTENTLISDKDDTFWIMDNHLVLRQIRNLSLYTRIRNSYSTSSPFLSLCLILDDLTPKFWIHSRYIFDRI